MLDRLEALFEKKIGTQVDWAVLSKEYPASALIYLLYIRQKYFSSISNGDNLLENAERNEDLARLYLFFYNSPLWIDFLLKRPNLEYVWNQKTSLVADLVRQSSEHTEEELDENSAPKLPKTEENLQAVNEEIEEVFDEIEAEEAEKSLEEAVNDNLELEPFAEEELKEVAEFDEDFAIENNTVQEGDLQEEKVLEISADNPEKEYEKQDYNIIPQSDLSKLDLPFLQAQESEQNFENNTEKEPEISENIEPLSEIALPKITPNIPEIPQENGQVADTQPNPQNEGDTQKPKITRISKAKTATNKSEKKIEDIDAVPKIKRSIKQLDKELLTKALGKSSKGKAEKAKIEKEKLEKKTITSEKPISEKKIFPKSESLSIPKISKSPIKKPVAIKKLAQTSVPNPPASNIIDTRNGAKKSEEMHSFETWLSRKEIKPVKGSFGGFANEEVEVYTEAMAKIYEKQGDLTQALKIYERLAEQQANKNFTNKISALKRKIKSQE